MSRHRRIARTLRCFTARAPAAAGGGSTTLTCSSRLPEYLRAARLPGALAPLPCISTPFLLHVKEAGKDWVGGRRSRGPKKKEMGKYLKNKTRCWLAQNTERRCLKARTPSASPPLDSHHSGGAAGAPDAASLARRLQQEKAKSKRTGGEKGEAATQFFADHGWVSEIDVFVGGVCLNGCVCVWVWVGVGAFVVVVEADGARAESTEKRKRAATEPVPGIPACRGRSGERCGGVGVRAFTEAP